MQTKLNATIEDYNMTVSVWWDTFVKDENDYNFKWVVDEEKFDSGLVCTVYTNCVHSVSIAFNPENEVLVVSTVSSYDVRKMHKQLSSLYK